jgi:hypothetical protein
VNPLFNAYQCPMIRIQLAEPDIDRLEHAFR